MDHERLIFWFPFNTNEKNWPTVKQAPNDAPITKESRHPGSDDCIPGQAPIEYEQLEWIFSDFFLHGTWSDVLLLVGKTSEQVY